MKRLIALSAFWLLATYLATACDCNYIPTFCEAMEAYEENQLQDYYNVHRVKIISQAANGLEVNVLTSYTGQNLAGQNRFILDGNGANCVLFASQFLDVGKEYIINARLDNDTFSLNECALSFLAVENDMVTGPIAPGVVALPLADFTGLPNCGNLGSSTTNEPPASRGLEVRPTLTTDQLTILAEPGADFQRASLLLTVYDVAGKLVQHARFDNFSPQAPANLAVQDWAAGVYFLRLEVGATKRMVRIVKV